MKSNPFQKEEIRCYLIFSGLLILFFSDVLFFGKSVYMRDTFCEFLPVREYVAAAWKQGFLNVLWNPYSGSGTPLLADPMATVFYPLFFPFFFFSAPLALAITWIIHFWIAGLALIALGRSWKLDPAPSLVLALSFVFGTWLAGRMEFLTEFATIAWGPVIMLLLTRIVEKVPERPSYAKALKGSLVLISLLTLVFTVQFFAGHAEMFIYSFCIALTYALVFCFCLRKQFALWIVLTACAIAGLLTCLLAMPQLVLTFELIGQSERSAGMDPGLAIASFHPLQWLVFWFPYLFGRPGYPNEYWAPSIFEFWVGTCYVGILPWLVLPFVFFARARNAVPRLNLICYLFITLGVCGLILAAGRYTPAYQFLYDYLPGYKFFRWPAKLLVFVNYGICILGALGYQALIEITKAQRAKALKVALVEVILSVMFLVNGIIFLHPDTSLFQSLAKEGLQVDPSSALQSFHDIQIGLIFFAICAIGIFLRLYFTRFQTLFDYSLVGVLFLNLFVVTRAMSPRLDASLYETPPPKEVLKLASENAKILSLYSGAQQWIYGTKDPQTYRWGGKAGLGDRWLPYGISKIWNGGMKLNRSRLYEGLLSQIPPEASERLADIMGITHIVGGPPFDQVLWGKDPNRHELKFFTRPNAFPRAHFAQQWQYVPEGDAALRAMMSSDASPRTAFIEDPNIPSSEYPYFRSGEITKLSDGPNTVKLEVTTPTTQMLVLNDTWYPGWRAFIDGKVTKIIKVNYLFRGILIPEGHHQVSFVYLPQKLLVGFGFAVLGLIILVAMLIMGIGTEKTTGNLRI